VLHCPAEYDYRYQSGNKKVIIHCLAKIKASMGTPLLVWETGGPDLKPFATTKADRKNNVSRIPPQSSATIIENTVEQPAEGSTRHSTLYSQSGEDGTMIEDFKVL
jgi:hypothetical protein